FELMDSAGIRAAADDLEKTAVERAADLAGRCDVALLTFDARDGPSACAGLWAELREGTRAILVGNKVDLLADGPPKAPGGAGAAAVVYLSARERTNIGALESALLEPYADLTEACRRGGAVVFCPEGEKELRNVRDSLEAEGAPGALARLQGTLRGRGPSSPG
ncbi:MAG: P-loop NTPase family protein, partial [Planctomycetota bacterium]